MARRLFDFSSLPRRERSYVLAAMLFWSILAYLGISWGGAVAPMMVALEDRIRVVVIIVGGLAYGFWESNIKPVASVDGTDISRSELEDRKKLQDFRAARFEAQTTAALAANEIDADGSDPQTVVAAGGPIWGCSPSSRAARCPGCGARRPSSCASTPSTALRWAGSRWVRGARRCSPPSRPPRPTCPRRSRDI